MKRHKKVLFDQIKEVIHNILLYNGSFFEYLKDRADYSRFPCFIRDGVGNRHSDQ